MHPDRDGTRHPSRRYGWFRSRRNLDAAVFCVLAAIGMSAGYMGYVGYASGFLPAKATGLLFVGTGIIGLGAVFALAQLALPGIVRMDWRCIWLDRDRLRELKAEEVREGPFPG